MWFDARAKLAEIAGELPAISATTATQAPAARPVSQVSHVSQPPEAQKLAYRVASVVTPPRPRPDPAPPARGDGLDPDLDGFPYGTACGTALFPRTWTGRIVSLAAWRTLTDWERHGPRGRRWNGATGQWEQHEGGDNG